MKKSLYETKFFKRSFFIYCFFSIIVNIAMFVVKIICGKILKSHSLFADAVHSLSDAGTSLVVLIGTHSAEKPPDKEHPFGHGQIHFITTMIVSIVLMFAGYEIFKDSLSAFLHPSPIVLTKGIFFLLIATIFVNEFLAQISFFLYRSSEYDIFNVDGHHHRADVLSSCLVIVAVICSHYGLFFIDGFVGIAISIWIVKIGLCEARKAIDSLIGKAPSQEELDEIIRIALSQAEVYRVHDIIYHKYGYNRVLSLHIELLDTLSFLQIHEITEAIEQDIQEKLLADVVVHTDPVNLNHPLYKSTREVLAKIQAEDSRVLTCYALRIIEHDHGKTEASLGISLADGQEKNKKRIEKEWLDLLKKRVSFIEFRIHIAPYWAYTPPGTDYFFKESV